MERHRQNEHRRLLEMAPRPFRRFRIHVQMRNNVIQKQKKRHTHTETDHRGKERPPPHRRRLLQRRKEQTEKRSSYHHTRCKSRKAALNRSVQPSPHEKDTRRTQRRTKKGNHKPPENIFHIYPLYFIL